jgi:hypothetical protein
METKFYQTDPESLIASPLYWEKSRRLQSMGEIVANVSIYGTDLFEDSQAADSRCILVWTNFSLKW